jgi:hypothetical protein
VLVDPLEGLAANVQYVQVVFRHWDLFRNAIFQGDLSKVAKAWDTVGWQSWKQNL